MPSSLAEHPTWFLDRAQVARLASPADYLTAVEAAFRALGTGTMHAAAVAHVAGIDGGFHIKSASGTSPAQVAIKINGNFPGNPQGRGLPTIQGCLMLADAADGRLLALMDSVELTARRTAASTALAASLLARPASATLALVGAGAQAGYHLEALLALPELALRHLHVHDRDAARARALCERARRLGLQARRFDSAAAACLEADIVVTCTTSRQALLGPDDVPRGCFVAAVGADHSDKQELAPALLARARVVTDLTVQAAAIGDLHHAIEAGVLRVEQVAGELGDVVCGRIAARGDAADIVVFDSTGVAATDLAAASMLLERARAAGLPPRLGFNAAPG
jgi:ornithine cyclodeaminase/alanine dehydrogenase-like protein (mu-crystallin family)